MKISWYYRRLMSMCPGEIVWRIKRLLWQTCARFLRKRWELQYERNCVNLPKVLEKTDNIKFYGLSDMRPEDIPQKWINGTVAAADKLMEHRYNYLALGEIDLGVEINWNREYKRDINTPLLFGPWMDYRDSESYGDFKYFWELPRLQHLVTLSKAYYLTSEEKYAEETIKQIKGFVKQSHYLMGVNWIMPMEAAIRLISLCWITRFLKNYLKKDTQACQMIESLVRSHVDYITANYAAYSSANNHLVGEAAGVFIASVCFGNIEKMRSHSKKAYNILCREIIHQHYADGVNKEQALHYQIFGLWFFLLAGLLGRTNEIEFPDSYWKMLEKSVNFIAAMANSDCSVPDIGDSDDGKAVVLTESGINTCYSLLVISSVLFNRADLKAKAKIFDETSFWLLGERGRDQYENLAVVEPAGLSEKFHQGGYYILKSNGTVHATLIFDCGPLGFESIAAHGHADALSFILSAYGQPYFVDTGSYIYIADNPYRNYFRSTGAHNTIVIDRQNQSEMAGAFLWTDKAKSFVDEWISSEQYDKISGWHDGYHRLQDPVTHKRAIKFDKEREVIIMDDYLEMKSGHEVEQYFHLASQCHVEKFGKKTWQISKTSGKIMVTFDEKLDCSVLAGSENPICGWFSNAYDRKIPISTFLCRGTFRGNQRFSTEIRILP
ncbi:MAG: alginate lyase family protein [Sedimentisphaerales bacterium]